MSDPSVMPVQGNIEELASSVALRLGRKPSVRLSRSAFGWFAITLSYFAMPAQAQIAVRNQGYIPYSDPPINYRSEDLHDPVAKLEREIEGGGTHLKYDTDHGYLKSVLELLKVPVDSQTLVFSKTSFQYPKISPEHPRALYFNDDVYVGSVHEGKAVEIVAFDPTQGAIFYLLDERKVEKPVFQRAELDCTQCHIAAGTRGVPGVLLRSIYPTVTGTQLPGTRSFITDQDSPFNERWGGWYVTGAASLGSTMGNAAIDDTKLGDVSGQAAATELSALPQRFDPSSYLASTSDVVAQLVLAHQTQMHNLITLTNYKTRLALYAQVQEAGSTQAADATPRDGVRQQFERPAEQLLRYLLFANETQLRGVDGQKLIESSAFAREFAARGTRDSRGRSLRDFDLSTRIFRYPCSYLIYSDAFEALPEPAKGYVYHRLLEILTGRDESKDFARLSGEDRRAVLEILLATKPQLPKEWQEYAKSNHLRVAESLPGSSRRS
jgi:hypothetical protein